MREGEIGDRALRLLLGMQDAAVMGELQAFGLTVAERRAGWDHLRDLVAVPRAGADPGELIVWAARWLSVAERVVEDRFPATRDWLFGGLERESFEDEVLAVAVFVQRYAAWPHVRGPRAAECAEVKAALAEAGLTEVVVAEGREVLLRWTRSVQVADAETRLTRWWRAWSQATQVAVEQRRMLNRLRRARALNDGQTARSSEARS